MTNGSTGGAKVPDLNTHGDARSLGRSYELQIFAYPDCPIKEVSGYSRLEFREVNLGKVAEPDVLAVDGEGLDRNRDGQFPSRLTMSQEKCGDDQVVAKQFPAEVVEAEQRGFDRGLEQGKSIAKEEMRSQLEVERGYLQAQAATMLESFVNERQSYLNHLEREAVELALAVAARVARREVQMDPLLLTGAVRVALGQLAESTSVRLRVPARDQDMWKEALDRIPKLRLRPEVIGEEAMSLGECRMETELGSVDLGLWAQLKEIERGFFDRVDKTNPPANSRNANAGSENPSEVAI